MSGSRRRVVLGIGAVVLAFVVVGVIVGPGDSGAPYDPASVGELGTKALVDTLTELGADVRVGTDLEGADVALLLLDRLEDDDRQRLGAWVAAGGRLVVADPASALAPVAIGGTSTTIGDPSLDRDCDLPLLADVDVVIAPGSAVYERPRDTVACFSRNGGHWFVATAVGEGVVIALGGPNVFVNGQLGRFDNAIFAAAVLLRDDVDATTVAYLHGGGIGGDATLSSLLPRGVRAAGIQLALAFALLVWALGRRLGRPVAEEQPVAIPASETVLASGNLQQRAHVPAHAAATLRADLRATLSDRLGVPVAADDQALVAAAATRRDVRADRLAALLGAPLPDDDEGLVRYAAEAEAVRSALLTPARR